MGRPDLAKIDRIENRRENGGCDKRVEQPPAIVNVVGQPEKQPQDPRAADDLPRAGRARVSDVRKRGIHMRRKKRFGW
jgi:hypothetical protein